MSVPPYGPALREAIAKGDLEEMQAAAKEAENYVREHGNVAAALATLKAEIAKAERRAAE